MTEKNFASLTSTMPAGMMSVSSVSIAAFIVVPLPVALRAAMERILYKDFLQCKCILYRWTKKIPCSGIIRLVPGSRLHARLDLPGRNRMGDVVHPRNFLWFVEQDALLALVVGIKLEDSAAL
jgi:hypothetical protein